MNAFSIHVNFGLPQNCTPHLHLNINTFKQSSSEHPNPQWLPPAGSKTPHLGFLKCWHGKWITSCRFLWNAKPLTNAWCPESFAEAQNSIFVFWINSIVQKMRCYSNQDGWAQPPNPERELCVDSDQNEQYLNTLKFDLIVDHSFHRQDQSIFHIWDSFTKHRPRFRHESLSIPTCQKRPKATKANANTTNNLQTSIGVRLETPMAWVFNQKLVSVGKKESPVGGRHSKTELWNQK